MLINIERTGLLLSILIASGCNSVLGYESEYTQGTAPSDAALDSKADSSLDGSQDSDVADTTADRAADSDTDASVDSNDGAGGTGGTGGTGGATGLCAEVTYGIPACKTCLETLCASACFQCGNGTDCTAIFPCVNACGGDNTCEAACSQSHPKGQADLMALEMCYEGKCLGPCTGSPPVPMLSGSTNAMVFLDTLVNESSASQTWTITNTGTIASGVVIPTIDGKIDFSIVSSNCGTLAPNASCQVKVKMTPQAAGTKADTLRVTANPGGSLSRPLSGKGLAAANLKLVLVGEMNGAGKVDAASPLNLSYSGAGTYNTAVPVGTAISLVASLTNGQGVYFRGWSEAGCQGKTCALTLSADKTVTVSFADISANIVFVSSQSTMLSMGTDMMDLLCNNMASAAGINSKTSNAFIALVSTSAKTAAARLGTASGFVRTDGKAIANTLGSSIILNPVVLDENGTPAPQGTFAITGTTKSLMDGDNCLDFTSTSSADKALFGDVYGGPGDWVNAKSQSCSALQPRFYCAMNSKGVSVPSASATGKRIYLSDNPIFPTSGLSGADAACDAQKPPGVATVKAMIGAMARVPSSVVTPTANYLRVDGQFVGTGADLISGGVLSSGIWQSASGAYVTGEAIFTGSNSPSVPGTSSTSCAGWSGSSGSAMTGWSGTARAEWWRLGSQTCTIPRRVICVEQ